jgi:hypothetical protein
MQLVITEKDYEEALGAREVKRLTTVKTEEILGPEHTISVVDALQRVIADRFRKMIPEDYEMREIQIKVAFSGTPFGVGVSGDATVKFMPKGADKKG